MKLKRILAGALTAVMVVANVPTLGLGVISAKADEAETAAKHYRYRSVEGMKVTTDWKTRLDAPIENLLNDNAQIALSRYNTGGIPRSSELIARNNIYIPLSAATDVSKLTWWPDNDEVSGGYGWNVEQGTVTRCKIYVTTDAVTDRETAKTANWLCQEGDTRFDSNESDNQNQETRPGVAHDVNIAELFGENAKQIKAIRMEVLNTAGQYNNSKDNRDVFINGREVEVFDSNETKLTLPTPITDFDCQSTEGIEKLIDGQFTHSTRMHSLWNPASDETAESGNSPFKRDAGKFFANNNIYFELPETTTIGKLTYVSGTANGGSIQRCRIYISNETLEDGEDVKDITDWGDPVFSNEDDADGWAEHDMFKSAVGNSKEAIFDELYEAKYVRMEVLNARGTQTSINNKWISGRRVYIYEAEEVNPSGSEVDSIELTVDEPIFNNPLRRPSTPNGVSYHIEDYDWFKDGSDTAENKENTDFGEGEYTLRATIETEDTIARITNATVNGNPARITDVTKGDARTTATISYTFAPIEDSTAAWTALKNYVNGTAKAIYEAGNVTEDGETQKYTARTWKRFTDIYTTAYTWTIHTTLDDPGNPLEPGDEIDEPSGQTKAEYEAALAELKKYCEPDSSGLVEIGDRREIDVERDTPDITVVAPEAGETPQNANLSYTGIIDAQDVKMEYRSDFLVDDEGWIHGTAIAPKEYEENDIFKVNGGTNFMVHFKVKVDNKVTSKQTIIGMLDDGYGLQILNGSLQVFGRGLNSEGGKVWPTTICNFTDDFYGKEHDIVAIFNGTYFHLYVDGVAGSERNQGDRIALSVDDNTVFAIGYNPNPSDYDVAQGLADQSFKGAMKDFNMYIGENCPDYSELTASGVTAEQFLAKLPAVLESQEPTLTLNGGFSDYEISTTSPTKWEELDDEGAVVKTMGATDTFKAYTDYKVTATLETKTGLYFSDNQGIMRTGDGKENELAEVDVELTDEDTIMTISYIFKGEEHPYDALKKAFDEVYIVGTVDNETNENAAGERLYTKASWKTYADAYAAAKTLAEGQKPADDADLTAYTTAKTNLENAIAGLKDAAQNCECTLGTISGFEGGTIELRGTSATKELTASCTIDNSDCLKHAQGSDNAAPVAKNVFSVVDDDADDAADAVIDNENGILTVTSAGTVKVALTVKLLDGTTEIAEKEAEDSVTYTVTSPIATEAEKADLKAKYNSAEIAEYKANKDTYTEATQTAMDQALELAEAVLNNNNATLKEVADALKALNDVQLVKKDPVGDDDKAALQNLMNEIAALDMNVYTADSWNAMKDVYDKALQMIEDGADDYSAILKELQDAKNALKTTEQDLADAKAEANKAVAAADAVMKAGKGDYSDASWNAFVAAYNVAKNAPANADAATLRKLAKALSDAQKALVKDTVVINNIQYKIVDAGKKTAAVVAGMNKKAKNITIPATVTIDKVSYNVVSINANAFKGYNKATKATIGKNVTTIGKNAFSGCKKLKNVVIKSSVLTTVHKTAFKKTAKGITAKVPKKLKKKAAVIKKIKKAGIKKIK